MTCSNSRSSWSAVLRGWPDQGSGRSGFVDWPGCPPAGRSVRADQTIVTATSIAAAAAASFQERGSAGATSRRKRSRARAGSGCSAPRRISSETFFSNTSELIVPSFDQPLAQRLLRALQPRLHRLLALAQRLGDRPHALAAEVAPQQQLRVLRVEPVERPPQRGGQLLAAEQVPRELLALDLPERRPDLGFLPER